MVIKMAYIDDFEDFDDSYESDLDYDAYFDCIEYGHRWVQLKHGKTICTECNDVLE